MEFHLYKRIPQHVWELQRFLSCNAVCLNATALYSWTDYYTMEEANNVRVLANGQSYSVFYAGCLT